jgi:hypothetical protein
MIAVIHPKRTIGADSVELCGVGKGGSAPPLRLPAISYAKLRFCAIFHARRLRVDALACSELSMGRLGDSLVKMAS